MNNISLNNPSLSLYGNGLRSILGLLRDYEHRLTAALQQVALKNNKINNNTAQSTSNDNNYRLEYPSWLTFELDRLLRGNARLQRKVERYIHGQDTLIDEEDELTLQEDNGNNINYLTNTFYNNHNTSIIQRNDDLDSIQLQARAHVVNLISNTQAQFNQGNYSTNYQYNPNNNSITSNGNIQNSYLEHKSIRPNTNNNINDNSISNHTNTNHNPTEFSTSFGSNHSNPILLSNHSPLNASLSINNTALPYPLTNPVPISPVLSTSGNINNISPSNITPTNFTPSNSYSTNHNAVENDESLAFANRIMEQLDSVLQNTGIAHNTDTVQSAYNNDNGANHNQHKMNRVEATINRNRDRENDNNAHHRSRSKSKSRELSRSSSKKSIAPDSRDGSRPTSDSRPRSNSNSNHSNNSNSNHEQNGSNHVLPPINRQPSRASSTKSKSHSNHTNHATNPVLSTSTEARYLNYRHTQSSPNLHNGKESDALKTRAKYIPRPVQPRNIKPINTSDNYDEDNSPNINNGNFSPHSNYSSNSRIRLTASDTSEDVSVARARAIQRIRETKANQWRTVQTVTGVASASPLAVKKQLKQIQHIHEKNIDQQITSVLNNENNDVELPNINNKLRLNGLHHNDDNVDDDLAI